MQDVNKSKAMKGIVRISERYNQPWRGFTLQRGHLFGEDERGYFVSAARPGHKAGTIIVYRCDTSSGDYVWRKTVESTDTEIAKRIMNASSKRGGTVRYEPVRMQIKRIYNPPLTTGAYLPMPHMRIPGGVDKTRNIMVAQA